MHLGLMKTVTRKTTTNYSAKITAEEIRKAFGFPDDAKVEFVVPGGGDWSHCSFEIDANYPVLVSWKEVTTEEAR